MGYFKFMYIIITFKNILKLKSFLECSKYIDQYILIDLINTNIL